MSADDDRKPGHTDEPGSWAELFGSVFESADEITARITQDEVDEKLNDTLRRAGAMTGTGGTMYLSLGRRSFSVTIDAERLGGDRDHRRRRPAWSSPCARTESLIPGSPTSGTPAPPTRVRPGGFWSALDPAEQLTFRRLAGERRFAAGVELMREGETADHVVVIMSGHTEISVRDGDSRRVVARRGPGELIGERAALQVSVRSATVVAIEPIVVLVMRTQDFATFISAHPSVLTIIEAMVYQRLTETGYRPAAEPTTTEYLGLRQYPRRQMGTARRLAGEQCTVIAANVVGLRALVRNDEDRQFVREVMVEMTRSALTDMWRKCFLEDRADGMVIAVPAVIPTLGIIECLTGTLPAALRRHNRIYNVCAQIQMRIAVETGPVHSQGRSLTGRALDRARQLLETPALTRTIRSSRANLGVIVSSSVYDAAIRSPGRPADYQPVRIEGMVTAQQPWMQMIDPVPEPVAL